MADPFSDLPTVKTAPKDPFADLPNAKKDPFADIPTKTTTPFLTGIGDAVKATTIDPVDLMTEGVKAGKRAQEPGFWEGMYNQAERTFGKRVMRDLTEPFDKANYFSPKKGKGPMQTEDPAYKNMPSWMKAIYDNVARPALAAGGAAVEGVLQGGARLTAQGLTAVGVKQPGMDDRVNEDRLARDIFQIFVAAGIVSATRPHTGKPKTVPERKPEIKPQTKPELEAPPKPKLDPDPRNWTDDYVKDTWEREYKSGAGGSPYPPGYAGHWQDVQAEYYRRFVQNTKTMPSDEGIPRASVIREKKEAVLERTAPEKREEVRKQIDDATSPPRSAGEYAESLANESWLGWLQRRTVQKVFDAYEPLRRYGKKVDDRSAYTTARLDAGRMGQLEQVFRTGALRGGIGEEIRFGTRFGFNNIFDGVRGKVDDFAKAALARRVEEVRSRGIEIPVNPGDHAKGLDLLGRDPAIKEALGKWDTFNRQTLEFAHESGVITKDQLAALLEKGQGYVPLYRLMRDDVNNAPRSKMPKILKELKGGGTDPVANIVENMARNTVAWNDLALRNRVKLEAVDLIKRADPEALVKEPQSAFKAVIADKRVKEAMKDAGIEDQAALVITRPNIGGRKNAIAVRENGKWEVYTTNDPAVAEMFQRMERGAPPTVLRIMGAFSNVLRAGVTLEPTFMFRNMIRDTMTASVQSNKAFIPFWSTAKGSLKQAARAVRKDPEYDLLMANGAGYGTFFRGDAAQVAKDVYRRAGINYDTQVLDSPAKLGRLAAALKRGAQQGFNKIEEVSRVFEEGSRRAEADLVRRGGGSYRDAAVGFRDVSTDFGMRGSSKTVQAFSIMVPFLNARLQGLYKLGRSVKENPTRTLTKGFTFLTLPAVAMYLENREDPEYMQLPHYIRDQHFIIPKSVREYLGIEGIVMIPKGFEWGAIFGSLPERIIEAGDVNHGKLLTDFLWRTVLDTFNFDPTPQIGKPIREIELENKKFSGAPIVPRRLENMPPNAQAGPYTPDILVTAARELKKHLGVEMSPIKVEAYIRGYFGSLGALTLQQADQWLGSKKLPTAKISDQPVIRGFYRTGPERMSQHVDDFYKLAGEATKWMRAVRDGVGVPTKDEEELSGYGRQLGRYQRRLGKLRKEQREIIDDEKMTPDAKRKAVDEIQVEINRMAKDALLLVPRRLRDEYGITRMPGEE